MNADIPVDDDVALSRHLAEIAARVALEAGNFLRPAFRADMTLEWKADLHDPVTVYDRKAEALIRERLMAAVPGSVVVGEEEGQSGDAGEDAISWFVDPIDGTANFARGLAFWCVSIGAIKGDRILAGAVHDPVAGHLFTADLQGAKLDGRPLRAPPAVEEAKALLIAGYPVTRDFRRCGREAALASQADLIEAFSTLRRPGSAALSLCHVAAGWADVAAGFGVNAWDVTAAILILEQAGGSYEALTLGCVPDDAPRQACPGYVARGPGGHFPTLDRVAREIDARRRRTAQAAA